LRDYFWERLRQKIDHVSLNGHPVERLPNTLNVRFEAIEGDSIIINLDLQGVAASAGSACTSGAQKASHVLLAMGMTPRAAQESLRFSLGRTTTKEEIEEALDALTKTVDRLRPVSAWHGNAERG
jgi:cysteine desulfurase